MTRENEGKRNRTAAIKLLQDSQLLFHVGQTIGDLGVIGEKHNRLILFLAGLTTAFSNPVSILIKGSTSSGKSNLIGKVVKLFPPELVVVRASLSRQAPVHSKNSLQGSIFYLLEYRGGGGAQYLLRLQQSEGDIAHEYTTVKGSGRRTEVARRMGVPVILTSTTEKKIHADDETRFASLWADESPGQTLAILRAAVSRRNSHCEPELSVWRQAVRLLIKNPPTHVFPDWFETIAGKLPMQQVRVRRDWPRFLTLCRAIALTRRFMSPIKKRDFITFGDYCVAYRILNPAFSSTVHGVHEREITVAECVNQIYSRLDRPVRVADIAEQLGWKKSLVYKFVKPAVDHGLVRYVSGTWPKNEKRLLPVPGAQPGFLPSPRRIFDEHEEIGRLAKYVDPLTGKTKILRRKTVTTEIVQASHE